MKFHPFTKWPVLFGLFFGISLSVVAQDGTTAKGSSNTLYFFQYDTKLQECDRVGDNRTSFIIIPQGSYFYITHIATDGYVITINEFKVTKHDTGQALGVKMSLRSKFNYTNPPQTTNDAHGIARIKKTTDSLRHFFLATSEFQTSATKKAEFI